MEIHLIRHTQPDIKPGICYGQTDLSLTEDYLEQFHTVLSQVDLSGSMIYSSPLQRCLQLAEFLSEQSELSPDPLKPKSAITQDSRLKELNFGSWEMKPWDEIPKKDFDHWAHDYVQIAPPDGESLSTMRARVMSFMSELPDAKHVIVTHSGVIRILWAHWHQKSIQEAFDQKIEFGQIYSYIDKNGPEF